MVDGLMIPDQTFAAGSEFAVLCVWPGTLMEENHTIFKKTNMLFPNSLPNAFQCGALPKMA